MTNVNLKRENWNSDIGFILACIGSAVGIGNIWRFPYIAGENGGAAFLVPFVIVVVSFGIILMVLEFTVGRLYKTSIVTSFESIRKKFKWVGVLIAGVALAILSYYLVILGWILSYFFSLSVNTFVSFSEFTNSYFSLATFFLILGITFLIVRKGISSGIEKFNKYGILCLIGILIPLTVYSLTLDGANQAIDYYFEANFDNIAQPKVWTTAFGQAFFSLSLGSGSLLTYGSYLKGRHSLIRSSSIIISINTMVSILAGLMIFSFVFSSDMNPASGIALIFEVLPTSFSEMFLGSVVGTIFFFLLLIAGLTSSVGLFQVPNASLQDSFKINNKKSSLIILILLVGVGLPSALSYTPIDLKIFDTLFLDFMDDVFGIYGITIAEMGFVIIVTWFIDKKKILEQANANSRIHIPSWAITLTKFVIPTVILTIIVISFLE